MKKLLSSAILCSAMALGTPEVFAEKRAEMPKALVATLASIKVRLSDVTVPAAVTDYLKAESQVDETIAKTAKGFDATFEKLMNEKGCDLALGVAIHNADMLNDKYKANGAAMAAAISTIHKALSDLTTAQTQSETNKAQIEASITYVNKIDPTIFEEIPCLCKKTMAKGMKQYKGGEVQYLMRKWKYLIDKNSEKTIPIAEDAGNIGTGTPYVHSRTPSAMDATAWVDKDVVVCVETVKK